MHQVGNLNKTTKTPAETPAETPAATTALRAPLSIYEIFAGAKDDLTKRIFEIDALINGYTDADCVVGNLTLVKKLLNESPRSDLVIKNLAPQVPIDQVPNLSFLNNFLLNIVFQDVGGVGLIRAGTQVKSISELCQREDPNSTTEGWENLILSSRALTTAPPNYRPLHNEVFDQLIEIGGRGREISVEKLVGMGIKELGARDFLSVTLTCHPAYIRMLIVIPEFSRELLQKAIGGYHRPGGYWEEEILAAYALMSRLVCETDPGVKYDNGEINSHVLF